MKTEKTWVEKGLCGAESLAMENKIRLESEAKEKAKKQLAINLKRNEILGNIMSMNREGKNFSVHFRK